MILGRPSVIGYGPSGLLTAMTIRLLLILFRLCCGGGDRTHDLEVMSLTSYLCSTPHFVRMMRFELTLKYIFDLALHQLSLHPIRK